MTATRYQAPLGELIWDEQLGWWTSGALPVPMFCGQPAEFTILPVSDDPNTPFEPEILEAITAFLALTPTALAEIEPHLWAYSREMASEWEDCPDISRSALWSHVQLSGVGVDRDDDGRVYVDLECNCDWEPEHGLQLVLHNGFRWVRVSSYSGHLTDGQAYGCPELDAWMADAKAKLPLRSREEIFAITAKRRRN